VYQQVTVVTSFIKNHIRLSVVILYTTLGLLIYSNVLTRGIFIFDDFEYIVGNSLVQSLTYFNLSDPRQVGYLSFAFNYAIGGENPSGYHLVNVIIHIMIAIFVFLLVGLVLRIMNPEEKEAVNWNTAISFLAGLIFLVHPLQTQAISYITQRFTSLSAFCYIVSVYLYLLSRERLEKGMNNNSTYSLYALSILTTVLGMKTKEIAFTIPFILTLFEFLLFRNSIYSRRRFFFLVPFVGTLSIIPLSLFGPQWGLIKPGEGVAEITRLDKIYDLTERSSFEYLFTQFKVIVTYIRLLILPINQVVVYDFKVAYSFFELGVILSLSVLLIIALSAFFAWKRAESLPEDSPEYRLFSLGIAWFFIALSVESSIIPIKDLIFEHRVYLPSIGFIIGISALIVRLTRKSLPHLRDLYKFIVVAALLAVPLSIGTYLRNEVWTDELLFWDDVVKKSPDKAIGYNNRGNAYGKRGQYELALQDLEKTISYFPRDPMKKLTWEEADFTPSNKAKTYMNRAEIYGILGYYELADADFQRAKQLLMGVPLNIDETLQRADLYTKHKAYWLAIEEYGKILALEPYNVDALNDRGNAYSLSGRYNEAIMDFDRAISLNPDFALAYYNRGIAYLWSGDKTKAMDDLTAACSRGFKSACESMDLVKKGNGKKR
jgi:tetratricopeptide (TPR) repeat protein